MKKIVYFMILMFSLTIMSCNTENKKIEETIKESRSYFFDVKTDLNFKCLSLEKIGDVYALDSANIYRKTITDTMKISLDSLDYWIMQTDSTALIYKKLSERYEWYESEHEIYLNKSEFYAKASKYLEYYKVYYGDVNEKNNKLLFWKYNCTYSIFNPLLQTRQEITDEFYITEDYKVLN